MFPATVKINTPTGYRFIEDVKPGDEVYCYTLESYEPGEKALPGRAFIRKVIGLTKSTGKVLEIDYYANLEYATRKGTFFAGESAWVLHQPEDEYVENDYKRVGELVVGDSVWTEYGDEVKVTAIREGDEEELFGLIVDQFETYIAGQIRVHGELHG